MNNDTLNYYRIKIQTMTEEEVRELAAEALYHLQVMCGSRNSFVRTSPDQSIPERTPAVTAMQQEAVKFSMNNA